MGISIFMATRLSSITQLKAPKFQHRLLAQHHLRIKYDNAQCFTIDRSTCLELYAATALLVSNLRGAFFAAEELAESALTNFLGFLRSPLADAVPDAVAGAGGLFSLVAAAGAGFAAGAEACGLEASLGGAFFCSASFLGALLLCALDACGLDADVCVEGGGLASACFGGAEVRWDFRGWGLDSLGDDDSVLDWIVLGFGASLGLGASFGVGACLGAFVCCGFCACRTACPSCCDACLAAG